MNYQHFFLVVLDVSSSVPVLLFLGVLVLLDCMDSLHSSKKEIIGANLVLYKSILRDFF